MARGFKKPGLIKLAIVVGGHPYDVPGFRGLFDRMQGIDYFIQDLDTWSVSKWAGEVWDQYDVHLFYDMHGYDFERGGNLSVRNDMDERIAEAVERLGEAQQGIVVLHHALLNFVEWQENETWNQLCNVPDRKLKSFHPNTEYTASISAPDHPITRGLHDWTWVDETFVIEEPGPGSSVLVATDSENSTKALGWVHEYKNSRVFCFQPGHDNRAYIHPDFQTILQRGIEWAARKI